MLQLQNLSSAAVVIGALKVRYCHNLCLFSRSYKKSMQRKWNSSEDKLCCAGQPSQGPSMVKYTQTL